MTTETGECRRCGKVCPVAIDETDPEIGYDEVAIDSLGLVEHSYYVCGECFAAAEDETKESTR
jgi:polyferredoxin